MIAVFAANNGELTIIGASNTFVIDAVQEMVVGKDVVHAKKTTLELNRRDAAKLRRALTAMLRKPRTQRASAVAQEAVA